MVTPLREIMPSGGQRAGIDLYRRGVYDPSPDGNPNYDARRTAVMPNNNLPVPNLPMNQGGQMQAGGAYGRVPAPTQGLAAVSGMRQDVMPRQTMQNTQPMQTMNGGYTTQQAQQPQYGLSGTEQAIRGGLSGGISAIDQGYMGALSQLGQARQDLGTFSGMGVDAINQGINRGLGILQGGMGSGAWRSSAGNIDQNIGQDLFRQASNLSGQFTDAGVRAQQQQLALSGALGQSAFDQALMQNAGTDLLKREAMDAVINQASATGGLQSGNVLKALQDRATGLAAQDLQNQYNRAAGLSQQGLQAAGQQGQFLSQAGQQMGNLAAQNQQMATQASIANASNNLNAALTGGQMAQQGGLSIANLMQNTGNQLSGIGQAGAGYGMQGGLAVANMFGNSGNAIANARQRAGEMIAGNVQNTAGGLANLQNQQGLNMGNLLGGNIASIADLYRQLGVSQSGADFNLGQLLANLAVGQGGQLSQLQSQIGAANAAGQIGQANAISGGIGNLLGIGAQAGWFGGGSPQATPTP